MTYYRNKSGHDLSFSSGNGVRVGIFQRALFEKTIQIHVEITLSSDVSISW